MRPMTFTEQKKKNKKQKNNKKKQTRYNYYCNTGAKKERENTGGV